MTRGVSEVADLARALLAKRGPEATVCPSEVARQLASTDPEKWREFMPVVHAAVDVLADRGEVKLSWKGKTLPVRNGPYRIGHAAA